MEDKSVSEVEDRSPIRSARIGVVAIGRNEGERLRRCLESVRGLADHVVYVDSGSSDGSVALGRALGVSVVELDLSGPFTASRARNEGFRRLIELQHNLDYVFFVDGDCEVVDGWLDKATRFLNEHLDLAIVWGFRRERFPEKSVYNMLCDLEWRGYPTGDVKACGGDALIRVEAFQQVKGYRPELICGEEPEMCVRLRQAGWRIWRLTDNMTLHDVAMYRFGQWWQRSLRAGYGFAQGVALHGGPPELFGVLESWRAWLWGLLIPLVAVVLGFAVGWWSLLLLLAYPLQFVRLVLGGDQSFHENCWRSGALLLSKFPEVLGQMKYLADRFRRVQSGLIEYK
jgi:GT2 family glycosyltransferase